MTQFPIFLINLDSSTERLSIASAALEKQGAQFTRIPAYDGRRTNPADVPEYSSAKTRAYMGRDLNGGEVGCFFSHIFAAQAFLETDAEYGLVLEDDISPTPSAIALTQSLIDWQSQKGAPDWQLCNLGNPRMKYLTWAGEIHAKEEQRTIFRAHYFPMTTTALLWTRQGAQAFIDTCTPIDCPVDHFMRRWFTRTDMGIAVQKPVFETTLAQSEIDISGLQKRRETSERSPLYGWLKAKRMYGDKIRATCHKIRWALAPKH
jgi:glycosyl transferase family 25